MYDSYEYEARLRVNYYQNANCVILIKTLRENI